MLRRLLVRMRTRGRVRLARGVRLGSHVRFELGPAGHVTIGARTVLGDTCVLACHERIDIGADVHLGDEVAIMDFDHATADPEKPVRLQGLLTGPVRIGDGAILGPGACVLRGVTVGPGAVVAARSVVSADVPAGSEVVGVPAKRQPRH